MSGGLEDFPEPTLPNWTLPPVLYHCPRTYLAAHLPECNGLCRNANEVRKSKDDHALFCDGIQLNVCEALDDLHSKLDDGTLEYVKAADHLKVAHASLWSCYKGTPLEFWIQTHMGHCLLRAAFFQSTPLLQDAKEMCEESVKTFTSCLEALSTRTEFASKLFEQSIRSSCLLGVAWAFYFKCDTQTAAKKYQLYAQELDEISQPQWQASREIDSIYFSSAFTRELLHNGPVSDASLHKIYEGILDIELMSLQINCHPSIDVLPSPEVLMRKLAFTNTHLLTMHCFHADGILKEALVQLLEQRCAGLLGDMWFRLGKLENAKGAYERSAKSHSLLLRAASLVGLGNVLYLEAFRTKSQLSYGPRTSLEAENYNRIKEKYFEAEDIYAKIGYKEGLAVVLCNLGKFLKKNDYFFKAKELCVLKYNVTIILELCLFSHVVSLDPLAEPDPDYPISGGFLQAIFALAQAWENHYCGVQLIQHQQRNQTAVRRFGKKQIELNRLNRLSRFQTLCENSVQTWAMLSIFLAAQDYLESAVQLIRRVQIGYHERVHPFALTMDTQLEDYREALRWCIACKGVRDSAVEALVCTERSRSRTLMEETTWKVYCDSISEQGVLSEAELEALSKLGTKSFESLDFRDAWKCLQMLLADELRNTIVVEYADCAEFGYLIFVINGSAFEPISVVRIPHRIDSMMFTQCHMHIISEEWDSEMKAKEDLALLYKWLIKPVEAHLTEGKQLIIIPHHHLCRVPFNALLDSNYKHLIERFPLACAESLRSLIRCLVSKRSQHTSSHQNPKTKSLVVGIRDHTALDLVPLEYAEIEATEVADILKKDMSYTSTQKLLGLDATKKDITLYLPDAQVIHFATHAKVDRKLRVKPDYSKYMDGCVVCAPPQKPPIRDRNGEIMRQSYSGYQWAATDEALLSNKDIASKKLQAQLAVLSACDTGKGVYSKEGVFGLGRALVIAGVPTTVLSLWPVEDAATRMLMVWLYKNLALGEPVANALQQAILAMMAARNEFNPKTPRWSIKHWAPFLPYGVPSTTIAKEVAVQSRGTEIWKFLDRVMERQRLD